MTTQPESHDPGRYTLITLGRRLLTRAPQLVRGVPDLLAGLERENSLGLDTRLAVQLRMARLLGCPVCLGLFPHLASKVGLEQEAAEAATEGRQHHQLATPRMQGALAWIEELIRADGEAPEMVPAAAAELTAGQRRHLQYLIRLDLVVHSAGLMFLPHSLIRRAAGL